MHTTPIDSEDLPTNTSQNEHFQSVVNRAVSRRGFLKFGSGSAAAVFLAGPLAACGGSDGDNSVATLLGFKAVAASTADTVVVAEGYTATVFVPWGTPLFSTGAGATWSGTGSETAADQARQVGDNHDGIHFYALDGSKRGLLAMNHEYVDHGLLFKDGMANWSAEKVRKSQAAHGVSVIEVQDKGGKWEVVNPSKYARRITTNTRIEFKFFNCI